MRVVAVDEARGLALCEEAEGSRSTVEIGLGRRSARATGCSCTPEPRSSGWRAAA